MGMTSKLLSLQNSGYDWQSETATTRENLQKRMRHIAMVVHLWLHAEQADGYRKMPEHKKVLEFIQRLFEEGSFFPPSEFNREDRERILSELLAGKKNLLPLEEVCQYVQGKPELAKNFFYDACILAGLDGRIMTKESHFLYELAGALGITQEDRKNIFSSLLDKEKTGKQKKPS
ncbi:MAG: hypothetical protein AAF518_09275 [Spirochaetota bacterium]